ncbi:MAG: DUF3876 domain-containing protein [Bacteroidales bacterium]|nr:DUF3876 domain-containing protein [Bacteroidales bacterium]
MEDLNVTGMTGIRLSINLNPTVYIHSSLKGKPLMLIIEMNENTRQANIGEYEPEKVVDGYFFTSCLKKKKLEYDPKTDLLYIEGYGEYQHG